MPDKIRVAVIGTGFGTTVHVPAFQSCADTEVVAICSGRPERAREAAAKFGIPHWSTDYTEVVNRPDVDLVSISTPPYQHHPMASAAIEAGKHVLLEKPMTLNVGEARDLVAKAKAKGVVHAVAHEFRFAPSRAYMKDLIDQGYLGQFRTVTASLQVAGRVGSLASPTYTWAAQRAMGGGVVMALGSHYIDALRFWFGDFAGVYGQTYVYRPERTDPVTGETRMADADDAFTCMVRFKNGGAGTLTCSTAALFGPGGRVEAYGSEGTLWAPQKSFNPEVTDILLGAKQGEAQLQEMLPPPAKYRPFDDDRDHRLMAFRLMVDKVVQAVKTGSQVQGATFEDGLKVQEVIDAIYESERTGRWVEFA